MKKSERNLHFAPLPYNFFPSDHQCCSARKKFHPILIISSLQITNVAQQGKISPLSYNFFCSDHQRCSARRNWEGEGCPSSGYLSFLFFTLNFGIIIMRRFEEKRLFWSNNTFFLSPTTSWSHLGMRKPTGTTTLPDLANTWTSTLTSKVSLRENLKSKISTLIVQATPLEAT